MLLAFVDPEALDDPVNICKNAFLTTSQLLVPTRQRNFGRWRASLERRMGTDESRSEEESSDA
jgi:hypothetical protein